MQILGSRGSVTDVARKQFGFREKRQEQAFVGELYTATSGWNFDLLQTILQKELFIADIVEVTPTYCLASRSKVVTVVQSTAAVARLFKGVAHTIGTVWQFVGTDLMALESAQKYTEYGALCTLDQAQTHGLYVVQEFGAELERFGCALVLPKGEQKKLTSTVVVVDFGVGKVTEGLAFLTNLLKDVVHVERLAVFPKNAQRYVLLLDDDYKKAAIRQAFSRFSDLEIGLVTHLGGAQLV